MTQAADELDKPALQDIEELATKKADEAKLAVNGALVAWNEAYAQLSEPLFFNLRAQINNDELFVNSIFKGLTVNNEIAKEHAKKLLQMLLNTSPGKS